MGTGDVTHLQLRLRGAFWYLISCFYLKYLKIFFSLFLHSTGYINFFCLCQFTSYKFYFCSYIVCPEVSERMFACYYCFLTLIPISCLLQTNACFHFPLMSTPPSLPWYPRTLVLDFHLFVFGCYHMSEHTLIGQLITFKSHTVRSKFPDMALTVPLMVQCFPMGSLTGQQES